MKQTATAATAEAIAAHPHSGHGAVPTPFAERYTHALADTQQARNLTTFQRAWRDSRAAMIDEIDFAALRDKLKTAKADAIDNLDENLDQFTAAAARAGARIHHAATGDDAAAIIHRIAEQRGVRLIAKSKSMVSEEIDLNHRFAAAGIETVETDLGEWIVQLRGERPSHMVMPAIHLARGQVGDVFTERLGRPISRDDVGEQVRAARDELREVFFTAGMGITGANALIVESGTTLMVTNEGNGRLCSSLPPVHVVLAGIEKLVPTFDDAITQLRLLARSATAQRLTVYSTFITGPTPGHELHIVLVDNGRRVMRALPEFREALHCIRCAACANVCPPYREVGGHVFGHIYTGAIGLVVTPFLNGLDEAAGPQSLCLSCNACETVCPVGIPLPRQILDVRKMVAAHNGLPVVKRVALAAYSRPRVASVLLKIGQRAQVPLTRGSRFVRARHLPGLQRQTRWRSLPALARRPLRERMDSRTTMDATHVGADPRVRPAPGQRGMVTPTPSAPSSRPNPELGGHTGPPLPVHGRGSSADSLVPNSAAGLTVALFPGCMTERLYPEQGEAVATVLRALGVRVVHPPGLHCCGLPANNAGDDRHARVMARQTIRALEKFHADYIVSGSASCVAMITQDYPHLLRDEAAWAGRAERVAARTMDFTTFLDRVAALPAGSLVGGEASPPVVTYHDSCQGLNALGLRDEPRRLLRDVLGCELRELPENTLCCGFGGSFSFDYPEVAARLMNCKLDNAESTGAPTVVTDNQGCIMHLRGGCDAAGRPLRVIHLAEVVAERILEVSADQTP